MKRGQQDGSGSKGLTQSGAHVVERAASYKWSFGPICICHDIHVPTHISVVLNTFKMRFLKM